jgi:hypothetical protein
MRAARTLLRRAAPVLAVALALRPAMAQEARVDLRRTLDLARALAAEGRAARDPLALLVAARLRRDLAMAPMRAGGEAEGLDTPAALADAARGFAATDDRIASLADDILASNEKGRERGPLYDIGRLPAGGREVYAAIRFSGGARAEIYVEAQRRVAVTVRDASGAPVCADDAGGPVAYCWWRQESEAALTVEIVNRSAEPMSYRLVTN